jgi:hypothetical protein
MKKLINGRSFLAVYAGVLTVVFALTVLTGAMQNRKARFGEIDVERINVIEPDGTVRLVLSNKALFPGILFKGKEYPHPNRKTAGILFYNDEGTENGGLTFGGQKDKDGNVSAYGHLSFDQYNQDQVFTLDASEDGGYRKAGMAVWDRPDYSIEELMLLLERVGGLAEKEKKAELSKFFSERESAHLRLYLGKTDNGAVSLRLNDRQGRDRLVIEVAPDGTPAVRFLDEDGKETGRFPGKEGER